MTAPDNNSNLESLRRAWQLSQPDPSRLDAGVSDVADRIARDNPDTLQQTLGRRLRRFSYVGIAMIPLAWLLYDPLGLSWWLAVAYALFGMLMGVLHRVLSDYVLSRRLCELPVAEAVRRAATIRMRQFQLRACGIILGVPLIACMFASFADTNDTSVVVAGVIGLCIGLAVGIPKAVSTVRLARRLAASVGE